MKHFYLRINDSREGSSTSVIVFDDLLLQIIFLYFAVNSNITISPVPAGCLLTKW